MFNQRRGIFVVFVTWALLSLVGCSVYDGYEGRTQATFRLNVVDSTGAGVPSSEVTLAPLYCFVNGLYSRMLTPEADGTYRSMSSTARTASAWSRWPAARPRSTALPSPARASPSTMCGSISTARQRVRCRRVRLLYTMAPGQAQAASLPKSIMLRSLSRSGICEVRYVC